MEEIREITRLAEQVRKDLREIRKDLYLIIALTIIVLVSAGVVTITLLTR